MPHAIHCHGLTRNFGDVRALDGLSLAVDAGAVLAFLGPNGAGKTTTIHLLLGLLEPTSGSARVLGFDPIVDGEEIRRHSGALLEHAGLYERLNAEDNLRVYARIAHLADDEREMRIAEVLQRFGLWERRHDRAGTFSRGMKQKLAIARVLLHRPSLVFLDEPTAGLDPEATVALRRDIRALAEEGTTLFLTTHNLADAEKVASHVAVIRQGRLLDFGTPAELRRRSLRTRVIVRTESDERRYELAADERVAPLVAQLVRDGVAIEEVRREEPSLEDVFLQVLHDGTSAPEPVAYDAFAQPPRRKREPLFRDILTVMRKEWREMLAGSSKVNIAATAILLAIIAAFAAVIGAKLIESPAVLSVSMVAFLVVMATVADSFAGERERHTLETLLASAMPDEALLLGKMSASVVYGWAASLVILIALLIGANVTAFPVFYPPSTILGALALTPAMLLAFSSAGVLLSMHAATVRDAQTRLSALLFGALIPFVLLQRLVPDEWRQRGFEMMRTEGGRVQSMIINIVFFALVDAALVMLAMFRFRRARLIGR